MNDSLELIGGRKMVVSHSLRAMAKAAKGRPILLLDRSGSMMDLVHGYTSDNNERKIDALRKIVTSLREQASFETATFDNEFEWTEEIGEPRGGTDLAGALDRIAADRPGAKRIVLITDGCPDNPQKAIEAAKRAPCAVDVFYVGPLDASYAQDFLKQLAEAASGKFGAADLSHDQDALENKVRLALTAGDPEEIAKGPIAL